MSSKPKNYRGVSCARCGEPIPASAKVVSLQDEIAQGKKNVPHTFPVRCQMCEQETVYEIKDLKRFEGDARRRPTRLRAARASS